MSFHTRDKPIIHHTQLFAEQEFPKLDPAQVFAFPEPQIPSVETVEAGAGAFVVVVVVTGRAGGGDTIPGTQLAEPQHP